MGQKVDTGKSRRNKLLQPRQTNYQPLSFGSVWIYCLIDCVCVSGWKDRWRVIKVIARMVGECNMLRFKSHVAK